MRDFRNKKIWIVGASEGIGRSLAKKLAAAGATLILSARTMDRLNSLLEELKGEHFIVPLDVTEGKSVERAWEKIEELKFVPDIFIYNSGYYEPMSALNCDFEIVKKMLDINLYGTFTVLSKIIPAFLQNRKGHIVLVGSVSGYSGLPRSMGYGASKAGIINLAESLYCDLKKQGIRVQVVNPGFVKTRLTDKNTFDMPFIITADKAANYIFKGLISSSFEIRFPWFFSTLLKILRILPYPLYFFLLRKL
jgi:short-subunit dehydrogenase